MACAAIASLRSMEKLGIMLLSRYVTKPRSSGSPTCIFFSSSLGSDVVAIGVLGFIVLYCTNQRDMLGIR
jgi:hypothetical protein